MIPITIEIHPAGGRMPTKAHSDDAAYDCYAREITRHNGRVFVQLGFKLELPVGWFADIRPRSSIHRTGLLLSNSAGIIDAGYRGEVAAVFYELDCTGSMIQIGDRVAQMMIRRLDPVQLVEGFVQNNSTRGTAGFGSTGA